MADSKLRPCLVNGKKALFHQWAVREWISIPNLTYELGTGGHCSMPVGIIEDENGQVRVVRAVEIRFLDNKVKELQDKGFFPEEKEEE